MSDNTEMYNDDLAAALEQATPVEVKPVEGEGTSVLSIRMPRSLLRELTVAARNEGSPPGSYARELLEQSLVLSDNVVSPAITARVLARLLESLPDELLREATSSSRPSTRWEALQPGSTISFSADPFDEGFGLIGFARVHVRNPQMDWNASGTKILPPSMSPAGSLTP